MATWTPKVGITNYATPTVQPAQASTSLTPTAPTASTSTAATPGLLSYTGAATGLGTLNNASAITRNVDNNELSGNQLSSLLDEDSPYLQAARTQALQQANRSGLLNTSMAAGAGSMAAIQAAAPFAQQQAQAFQNVLNTNQNNQQQVNLTNASAANNMSQFNAGQTQQNNQFNANNQLQANTQNIANAMTTNQFNANAANQQSQFNAQQQQQNNQFNASTQNQQSQFNTGQTNQMIATMLDQQNKMQLADIEASYKTLMQADDAAFKFYQSTLQNISDIMMNPDLTPTAKNTAVTNQNTYLRTGLQILGSMNNIDFGNLLNFPAANAV